MSQHLSYLKKEYRGCASYRCGANIASEVRQAMLEPRMLQVERDKQCRSLECCKTSQTSNIESLYVARQGKQAT